MILIKNYLKILLATISKKMGRGKYYRKKVFSTVNILNKNFAANTPFNFIQIGANDGVSFDFLYNFVKKRAAAGIVVEPVKEYYDELCINYKDNNQVIKVNKALHKSEKSAVIYKVEKNKIELYPDWVKGIASFDRANLTKFNMISPEHILEEIVEAENLMNIVYNCRIKNFDYLQVDTEGYDYEVIKMIDFSKLKPKLIRAEFINLSNSEKVNIKKLLLNQGYYVFFEEMDIIGVNLKRIKL